jgi:polyisoprenoid-binding protein YceI
MCAPDEAGANGGLMRIKAVFSAAVLAAGMAGTASAAHYTIDPDHTTVMFKVRHVIGKVTGTFDKFVGEFDFEPGKPQVWQTSATIDASSINTKVAQRDKHLRSEDFFEVDEYPTLQFVSTKVTDFKDNHAKLHGKLTIRDKTLPVTFDLEIAGAFKDPGGDQRAAFTATGRINRKDFGLTWNDVVETGGVLVGDDVDIELDVEGLLQAPKTEAKAKTK